MDCWHILEDIKTLSENVCEGDLTKDQITNVLLGMEELYQLRFEKTYRIFEQVMQRNNSYNGLI
jgi:hypothetical protein